MCSSDLSLVGPSMSDPAEYYINNVAKTAKFLDLIRWLPVVPYFVFSSSAAVYGSPDQALITEGAPYSPLSPYGQTKSMIEIMLTDFYRAYGIRSMSLRYFNACGADLDGELGQAPGATHIIARLLESLRDDQDFVLYGDGSHVRDYVHVADLARAHLLAIEALARGDRECAAINLGAGQGRTNQEIIEHVSAKLGAVRVNRSTARPGDPQRLVASNDMARTVLGWQPELSDLDTIVSSAWKWYNNPSQSIDNAV